MTIVTSDMRVRSRFYGQGGACVARTKSAGEHDREIGLPLPPASGADGDDLAIYASFMRYLRGVPHHRLEIRILSAIQFTADMTDTSDAHVTRVLVDFGLRAPPLALPADFLRFADQALLRGERDPGAAGPALRALKMYWDAIGEDVWAAFRNLPDCALPKIDRADVMKVR